MKKLLLLLVLVIPLSCSKGDEPEPEPDQGYTSYTFLLEEDTYNLFDVKSAYYDKNGECKLLCKHGDFIPFIETEEFIMPEFHDSIYIFYRGDTRLTAAFTPRKNKKNKFILSTKTQGVEGSKGIEITEKTIYNWPH